MGPGKLSSICNYFIESHLPASCGAFTFRGRIRPSAKISSREQGLDFDLVGTCKWLSYVRPQGHAYDVLVRFFPLQDVYRFESLQHSRIQVTAYSLLSSRSMFGVLLIVRGGGRLWLYYHDYFIYFTFDIDMGQHSGYLCRF
jgi:hypothetical protein